MAGKANVRGFETIIKNMESLTPAVMNHLRLSVNQATKELRSTVDEHIELTCHSLADLADLGHPYSTRFPEDSFVHPDDYLHIQSGHLHANVESISEVNTSNNTAVAAVGVSENKVPYIGYLIDGTSKMRPRDFLGNSMLERKDDLLKIIKYGIVEGLGSRGTVK